MLDSVLYARDRWLNPNGRGDIYNRNINFGYLKKISIIVYPSECIMYIGGVDHQSWKKEKIQFWDDVYGTVNDM